MSELLTIYDMKSGETTIKPKPSYVGYDLVLIHDAGDGLTFINYEKIEWVDMWDNSMRIFSLEKGNFYIQYHEIIDQIFLKFYGKCIHCRQILVNLECLNCSTSNS